jgi:hypothetical protein
MVAVLKEMAGYTFFLSVVFLVAYGNRPPASYPLQAALKRQFVESICDWVRPRPLWHGVSKEVVTQAQAASPADGHPTSIDTT